MIERVHGFMVEDLKQIGSGCGGSSQRASLSVETKDGVKHEIIVVTNDSTSFKLANDIRIDLKRAYNEHNNVKEKYILENEAYIFANGRMIRFGTRCIDILDNYVMLTNMEIEALEKQFKIVDEGWRHLAGCNFFVIKDNKVDRKIPQRYVDQLKHMGYDVDLLEYELEESN